MSDMRLRHMVMALRAIGYACGAGASAHDVLSMAVKAMRDAGISDADIATELLYWYRLTGAQNVHAANASCTQEGK